MTFRKLVRTAASHNGSIELTVEDSGKGIAEAISPAYSNHSSPQRRKVWVWGSRSAGLIVQARGGRFWAECSTVSGAIFPGVPPVVHRAEAAAAQ